MDTTIAQNPAANPFTVRLRYLKNAKLGTNFITKYNVEIHSMF